MRATEKSVAEYSVKIFIAVAIALVLYGGFRILSEVAVYFDSPDHANEIFSYIWSIYRIILAVITIYIGAIIYKVARKASSIEVSSKFRKALSLFKRQTPPFTLLLITTLGAFIPIILSSFSPVTTSFSGVMFFKYKVGYGWHYKDVGPYGEGGYVALFTLEPHGGGRILLNVIKVLDGWVVVPYRIEEGFLEGLIPASGFVKLGFIDNGFYRLYVVMRDFTDIFKIHKTEKMFYVEATPIVRNGYVVEQGEFEKRLDGFTLGYGWAERNEMRVHVVDLVAGAGGEIIDTNIPEYPNPISIRFYYDGDFDKLSNIILDLAKQHPNSSIGIRGNDGHFASIHEYVNIILVLPEHADKMRILITDIGLVIYDEEMYKTYSTTKRKYLDFVEFHVSSAPLEKHFAAIRSEIIERIEDELSLESGFDKDYLVFA